MGILKDCIKNKRSDSIPIWFMRQAGRYLPEFREIRSRNPDFIKLCLNPELSKEITLQPLKRFAFDAAIIFSDILLIPFALGQEVKFEKNFGPKLGELNLEKLNQITDEVFIKNLKPVHDLLKITAKDKIIRGKDLIGFVGATWTLLVYMLNRKSPKKQSLDINMFNYPDQDFIIDKIIQSQKIHIKGQVENGATIIQIFDSWAGLLEEDKYEKYIYEPTKKIVDYVKTLGVEVICFPRGIKKYAEFCKIINPSAINIDYETDPKKIAEQINIPIQGGIDPKSLLFEEGDMIKEAKKYLDIFKNHQYIFNLGHGILPETSPDNVKALVNFVKDYK